MAVWEYYILFYSFFVLLYLWYRYILLFITELKKEKKYKTYNPFISVLIPFYNEQPNLLEKCVRSCLKANGNKEIIVVDDGSPDKSAYERLKSRNLPIKLLRYEKNKGKRHAQVFGLKHIKGDVIVTVDSDTIVKKDAIVNLVQPLGDPRVGATTGNVLALNEKKNLLTKMIGARYWSAFNIERKSLSSFGIVTCCSGVLSAYKKSIFDLVKGKYISQKFLGSMCTYGDDRHLTNLFLELGYKIEYVETALCYTNVPENYWEFIRQQLRWKKSFFRESLVTLSFSMKKNFLLSVEVIWNLLLPLLSLAVRVSIIFTVIFYPVLILPIATTIVTVAIIRNYFLILEDKKRGFYCLPYAFLHEFVLYWLYLIALFTMKDVKWGTRS